MELKIPEAEIIGLISSLESDSCPMPRGESSGLSSLRPREAYAACAKGISCRKKGDFVGANEAFIEKSALAVC